MLAVVLKRYGSPAMLRVEEVEKPVPSGHRVLVRVKASAINDWDWTFVRGRPYAYRALFGLLRPKVAILGAELAGVVEAVGPAVTRFRPGDEVYGDVSEAGFGGFAQYACVNERALCAKPARMSFEQAAATPHAALLALQGLVDIGKIQSGERVLVNGAGGGVGMFAVQIAKRYGAHVTGVDSAVKLEAMRSLGFDHVIDYTREDFTRSAERYDLILDTKTNRSPRGCLEALGPRGRYVTVGGSPGRMLQLVVAAPLLSRATGKTLRIVALKPNQGLDTINDMFEREGLSYLVDGPFPLTEVPQAMQRFGDADHIGKVVIRVSA